MGADVLPAPVRQLVEEHFETVTAVEVLLFLHRERRSTWSSRAVALALRFDVDQTEEILRDLHRRGLVRRRGLDFEYAPGSDEEAGAVDLLAGLYPRYRSRISALIFSKHHPPLA